MSADEQSKPNPPQMPNPNQILGKHPVTSARPLRNLQGIVAGYSDKDKDLANRNIQLHYKQKQGMPSNKDTKKKTSYKEHMQH